MLPLNGGRLAAIRLGAALLGVTVLPGAALADIPQSSDARSVQLNVHGRIEQHCTLGSIGDVDFGDITRPNLSSSTHVQLSCNLPFAIRIQSAHGGLANVQYPHGQGPYSGTLDYTLGVAIPLRRPDAVMLEQSFSSRDLMSGRVLSSGEGIALDGMALTVALGRPSGEAGLLGGNYAETIVITIAPS